MRIEFPALDHVSDADLLARVRSAVANERHATAQLIALLMALDVRRLYLAESCSSLFTYCTQVLGLTEHAAYGRIEAARKFPLILERLHDGTLTLTAVGLLAPHLTAENRARVLDTVRHKTKREVEQLVATLHPKPDTTRQSVSCRCRDLRQRRLLLLARKRVRRCLRRTRATRHPSQRRRRAAQPN